MTQVGTTGVVYKQHHDATPASEVSALAQAYAYILQKHHEKQKGRPTTSGPDSAKGGSSVSSAKGSIP